MIARYKIFIIIVCLYGKQTCSYDVCDFVVIFSAVQMTEMSSKDKDGGLPTSSTVAVVGSSESVAIPEELEASYAVSQVAYETMTNDTATDFEYDASSTLLNKLNKRKMYQQPDAIDDFKDAVSEQPTSPSPALQQETSTADSSPRHAETLAVPQEASSKKKVFPEPWIELTLNEYDAGQSASPTAKATKSQDSDVTTASYKSTTDEPPVYVTADDCQTQQPMPTSDTSLYARKLSTATKRVSLIIETPLTAETVIVAPTDEVDDDRRPSAFSDTKYPVAWNRLSASEVIRGSTQSQPVASNVDDSYSETSSASTKSEKIDALMTTTGSLWSDSKVEETAAVEQDRKAPNESDAAVTVPDRYIAFDDFRERHSTLTNQIIDSEISESRQSTGAAAAAHAPTTSRNTEEASAVCPCSLATIVPQPSPEVEALHIIEKDLSQDEKHVTFRSHGDDDYEHKTAVARRQTPFNTDLQTDDVSEERIGGVVPTETLSLTRPVAQLDVAHRDPTSSLSTPRSTKEASAVCPCSLVTIVHHPTPEVDAPHMKETDVSIKRSESRESTGAAVPSDAPRTSQSAAEASAVCPCSVASVVPQPSPEVEAPHITETDVSAKILESRQSTDAAAPSQVSATPRSTEDASAVCPCFLTSVVPQPTPVVEAPYTKETDVSTKRSESRPSTGAAAPYDAPTTPRSAEDASAVCPCSVASVVPQPSPEVEAPHITETDVYTKETDVSTKRSESRPSAGAAAPYDASTTPRSAEDASADCPCSVASVVPQPSPEVEALDIIEKDLSQGEKLVKFRSHGDDDYEPKTAAARRQTPFNTDWKTDDASEERIGGVVLTETLGSTRPVAQPDVAHRDRPTSLPSLSPEIALDATTDAVAAASPDVDAETSFDRVPLIEPASDVERKSIFISSQVSKFLPTLPNDEEPIEEIFPGSSTQIGAEVTDTEEDIDVSPFDFAVPETADQKVAYSYTPPESFDEQALDDTATKADQDYEEVIQLEEESAALSMNADNINMTSTLEPKWSINEIIYLSLYDKKQTKDADKKAETDKMDADVKAKVPLTDRKPLTDYSSQKSDAKAPTATASPAKFFLTLADLDNDDDVDMVNKIRMTTTINEDDDEDDEEEHHPKVKKVRIAVRTSMDRQKVDKTRMARDKTFVEELLEQRRWRTARKVRPKANNATINHPRSFVEQLVRENDLIREKRKQAISQRPINEAVGLRRSSTLLVALNRDEECDVEADNERQVASGPSRMSFRYIVSPDAQYVGKRSKTTASIYQPSAQCKRSQTDDVDAPHATEKSQDVTDSATKPTTESMENMPVDTKLRFSDTPRSTGAQATKSSPAAIEVDKNTKLLHILPLQAEKPPPDAKPAVSQPTGQQIRVTLNKFDRDDYVPIIMSRPKGTPVTQRIDSHVPPQVPAAVETETSDASVSRQPSPITAPAHYSPHSSTSREIESAPVSQPAGQLIRLSLAEFDSDDSISPEIESAPVSQPAGQRKRWSLAQFDRDDDVPRIVSPPNRTPRMQRSDGRQTDVPPQVPIAVETKSSDASKRRQRSSILHQIDPHSDVIKFTLESYDMYDVYPDNIEHDDGSDRSRKMTRHSLRKSSHDVDDEATAEDDDEAAESSYSSRETRRFVSDVSTQTEQQACDNDSTVNSSAKTSKDVGEQEVEADTGGANRARLTPAHATGVGKAGVIKSALPQLDHSDVGTLTPTPPEESEAPSSVNQKELKMTTSWSSDTGAPTDNDSTVSSSAKTCTCQYAREQKAVTDIGKANRAPVTSADATDVGTTLTCCSGDAFFGKSPMPQLNQPGADNVRTLTPTLPKEPQASHSVNQKQFTMTTSWPTDTIAPVTPAEATDPGTAFAADTDNTSTSTPTLPEEPEASSALRQDLRFKTTADPIATEPEDGLSTLLNQLNRRI